MIVLKLLGVKDMKKVLLLSIASILSSILYSNLQAGSSFGSSFGGSLLGSFVGSSVSNAVTQPRQVVVREQPVYVQQQPQPQYVEVRHTYDNTANNSHRYQEKKQHRKEQQKQIAIDQSARIRQLEQRNEMLERELKEIKESLQQR